MVEGPETGPEGKASEMDLERKVGHSHQEIIRAENLPVYQEVATRHKISIVPVAEEGEEYKHLDPRSQETFSGHVEKGKVYISVSSSEADITDFYRELGKELAGDNNQEE